MQKRRYEQVFHRNYRQIVQYETFRVSVLYRDETKKCTTKRKFCKRTNKSRKFSAPRPCRTMPFHLVLFDLVWFGLLFTNSRFGLVFLNVVGLWFGKWRFGLVLPPKIRFVLDWFGWVWFGLVRFGLVSSFVFLDLILCLKFCRPLPHLVCWDSLWFWVLWSLAPLWCTHKYGPTFDV